MRLKSFGCSFVFGTDLADAVVGTPINHRINIHASEKTWPALLAQELGLRYECYARPGAGNLQILEQLLNHTDPGDTVTVSWTWIDRFDYVDFHNKWPGSTAWSTIRPNEKTTLAEFYYKNLHSQYQDKFQTLIYAQQAVDHLQKLNCNFVMTHNDNLMFETEWHTSPAVQTLQNSLRSHMTMFEGQTFLNWSQKKGFPISETLHPLEPAHQAAFDLIKSYNLV